MVILGLGSNIGDKLAHLRKALTLLKKIPQCQIEQVSPVYISDALLPENAASSWNTPYLNAAIRCRTTLTPHELLEKTKSIEKQLGRDSNIDWSPRIIDIDILAWDDLIKYGDKLHIPHEHLHERPFALWPLADVAPFWIYPLPGPFQGKTAIEMAAQWGPKSSRAAPLQAKQIAQRIDTPALMGIMNITPDSFSDGGKYVNAQVIADHIKHLVDTGAEIIDLGAESTRPNAKSISTDEEWQRLEPVLTALMDARSTMLIPPKISIDTRHAVIAQKSLRLGVDWINDVTGLDSPEMRAMLTTQSCDVVFMHHLGVPVNPLEHVPIHQDPTSYVYRWAEKRIAELGIAPERLIFDVGIGYGKTAEQSLALIKNIAIFRDLGVRLLVGHSRKSFLSQFTEKPASERDIETIAISLYLTHQQTDYLRVHHMDKNARALKVKAALSF